MMIGCSECPRSQWLISKSRTLEFSVLVLGRKMKLNQREVKRNSFGCGSPFALLWTPICHTRTLYQLLIQDTLKKNVQFNQNFLHYLVKLHTQMHLYIEPLNGSIDVTSFFRRM